jgi:hypothetical protein
MAYRNLGNNVAKEFQCLCSGHQPSAVMGITGAHPHTQPDFFTDLHF